MTSSSGRSGDRHFDGNHHYGVPFCAACAALTRHTNLAIHFPKHIYDGRLFAIANPAG